MHRCILLSVFLFICFHGAYSWDRYSNETEYLKGTYSFQKILRYSFSVSSTQTVTLETKNTRGDPYMYLWSNTERKQIAKNNNSGAGLNARITASLRPGSYIVFVRSNFNNRPANCDLYKNGTRVVYQGRYSGYKVYVGNLPAETRFRTTNLSSGSDTYCLLVNSSYNLIGYNNNSGGKGSMIVASEKPRYFIVGAYSNHTEGTCKVRYTRDSHLEYLALCGNETRHAISGNCFDDHFNSGDYYYSHVLASRNWMFRGPHRMSYVDGVDLVYIHAHGGYGRFTTHDHVITDFTHPSGSAGSGHRTNNRSGDLEYIAFMTCKTVRIESETSWSWLVNRGWKSKYNSDGTKKKGFFDGAHVVVGYHSNHNNVSRAFLSHDSYWYEAKYFANNLDKGQSIWNAWKNANKKATDKTQHWLWCPDVDLGVISSIHIVPQKNESIAHKNSPDYTLGSSNYYFGWRKSHYWYD